VVLHGSLVGGGWLYFYKFHHSPPDQLSGKKSTTNHDQDWDSSAPS